MQRTLEPATVFMVPATDATLNVHRWNGGAQATTLFTTETLGSPVRVLLQVGDATYMALNADNTWITRLVTDNVITGIGHPAVPGPPFPSTLFDDGDPQTTDTALLTPVALTDLVHGLGTGAWQSVVNPDYGWVATASNIVRLHIATAAAVRFAGNGVHGCFQQATFVHKQLWQGDTTCLAAIGGAAFVQTASTGDGLVFFSEGPNVHVVDTTLSVGGPNVETNVPDSSALSQAWLLDPTAVLKSSGGAVVATSLPGEYLYVIPGTLCSDGMVKSSLFVYNYLTNTIQAWSPAGQPFTSIGGIHYVREIFGGHPTDVLLVTGEAGVDNAWSISVADLIAEFTTATTAAGTTVPPPTTTPGPVITDAIRVPFTGDNVRVAQYQLPNRVVVRSIPSALDVFALDIIPGPPSALFTLTGAVFALFSDGSDSLHASLVDDTRTRYNQAGNLISGPTVHNGASLSQLPDSVWWNAIEDGDFTGVLPATVVVVSTASIALADRQSGELVRLILGGTTGCSNQPFVEGTVLIGSTMCARDLVAPALIQTLSSRFVYFHVTGSPLIFKLDAAAAVGTQSVEILGNRLSSFPAAPFGTLAPVAVSTNEAVSGVAFIGGRPGEVYYVSGASAFGAAGDTPHELLVWNSRDHSSRWVDTLNVRGAMDPAFIPAGLHTARLQNGAAVLIVGGTGSTTDFAVVPSAAFRGAIYPLVDECVAGIAVCTAPQVCEDEPTSWACLCPNGYHPNGFRCDDNDECEGEGGGHNCDSHAVCGNTQGSFTCACVNGFTGDGVTCADVDECTLVNACPTFATCTNVPGTHVCACLPGYTGTPNTVCYPTSTNEVFNAATIFGSSASPTALVGGNGGYVVTVDRTTTSTILTPITFSVVNPTEVLVIDMLGVVLSPDVSLGVLFQVSGPVSILIVRNLVITGSALYTVVAGTPTRVVFSDGTVDAPGAKCFESPPADFDFVTDNTVLIFNTLHGP